MEDSVKIQVAPSSPERRKGVAVYLSKINDGHVCIAVSIGSERYAVILDDDLRQHMVEMLK